MDKFFFEVPTTSCISKAALAYAKSQDVWHKYYNFEAVFLPSEIAAQEPLLLWLANNGFDFQVGILCIRPNTCYRWHKDTDRLVGINMLLSGGDSKCLFADSTDAVTFNVTELAYQPDKYYVFNTQADHTVLNFSGDRYVLSVEFLGLDRGMSYADVCSLF
jgi:hypothetical protein